MARRTKAEKFDIEVEAALEAALDFDFDHIANPAESLRPAEAEGEAERPAAKPEKYGAAAGGQIGSADFEDSGAVPSFSEAFFSLKDLADEDSTLSQDTDSQAEIFDLRNLERQIASAAEELNKPDSPETKEKSADRGTKIIQLPAEGRPQEFGAAARPAGNFAENQKSAAEAPNKDYIIVGGDFGRPSAETAARGEYAPAADSAAKQSGAENADSERAASGGSLARFLQEQDFQAQNGGGAAAQSAGFDDLPPQGKDSGADMRSPAQGEPPAPPRPSGRRPLPLANPLYWATAFISILWAAGGIGVAHKLFSESGLSLSAFIVSAQGLLTLAGGLVPILMFWGFAQLARRAKELQKVVQTMTGAAMRLLEPEHLSKERVSGLGHIIRREVAAMDAGIDRTMSHASELEALLQNEVNNLERSYGENEVRIRSLIAELANEREAVATHADNVKAKITGAKDQLTQEFNSIADHINATAESFTIALSETLNSRWSELVNEFNNANEEVASQLSQKFIDTVQSFDASRGQFFEELDTRFSQIDAHTEAAGKAVAERLGGKMDDFVKIVQERTEEVEGRFDILSVRLADSGHKVIDSVNGSVSEIEQRTQDIEQRLQSSSDKVLGDFEEKFHRLDDAVIDRGNRSLSNFSEQIDRLEERTQDLPMLFDDASAAAAAGFDGHLNKAEEKFRRLSEELNKGGAQIADSFTRSIDNADKQAQEMNARLDMNSKAVMGAFESKLDALDNLLLDRSNRSAGRFAEQIQKLEKKSEGLASDFDIVTQSAVHHFEERLNAVDNLLSHKSTSLIRSFIEKTESLEESTDRLNAALEVHVERVNEAFRSRAGDITESLTNGRNDILSIIDETKTRLSHEMEIVGTTIGKLVDERAGGFIYQFIEGREKLSHTLQDETGRIINSVGAQIAKLSAYVGEVEKSLQRRAEEIDSHARSHIEQLNSKTSAFEKSIAGSFGLTRELIETQARNIDIRADSLRDSLSLNSKELQSVLGEQAAVLEERIAAVRQVIADSDGAFADAMQNHLSRFGESVSSGDNELKQIFLTHLENLEGQTGRLRAAVNDGHAALELSLEGKIVSLQNVFSTGREAVETLLDKHGNVISERALQLQDNLAQTLTTVDENLGKQSEILDKRAYDLRDAVDYNSTVLSDSFLRQTAIIDERTKTVQKALEIGMGNVRAAFEDNAASLSNNLRERLIEVSSSLNAETHKAENIISAATDKLLNSVFEAADNADQKLAGRGAAIGDIISRSGEKLGRDMGSVEARFTEISGSLSNEAEKAGSVIAGAGSRLSGSVLRAAEQADKIFADRGADLQNNLAMIEGRLTYGLQSVQEQMLGTAQEIEQKLDDKSLTFKGSLQKIGEDINTDVDSIRERITELTHNTAQELLEKTGSLHSLTEQLRNAATRTSDSLANLTGTFSKQLHEVTQAAEERLRQENENFISTFSGRTEDAVFAVRTAKTELEGQVNHLLEGLESSNSSIQMTVGSLRDNVGEVDKRLGSLTAEFKQNIEELSKGFTASGEVLNRNLQHFSGQSQQVTENIAKFSEQFDKHAALLTEAGSVLENANGIFADKLENNQESLNKLADGLIHKSDEIAGIMRDCEHIIGSVIKDVEDKTWSSAGELRSSLSALINEAAGRFEGATGEIRRAADEIREELTRTKSDFNRGLRDLPMQTKEYTDAMRKAVADQIEALKDLSGIVEQSGLLFDVSRPQANSGNKAQDMRNARSEQTAANGAAAPAGAGADYAAESGFKKPSAAPYAAAQPQPAGGAVSPAIPAQATAQQADRSGRTGGGWVSDLLARVSQEDAPVPPSSPAPRAAAAPAVLNGRREARPAPGATLNSMSADIVQAIDRDGIAKLWQHYRRGQRNIAPHQLYTPEGYRVFEDIRQKYNFDGEFRRAVGQYISDFEHLLGDVTRNGGNNGTVRDYLTSDTGKVYTMLAHASGRIQ